MAVSILGTQMTNTKRTSRLEVAALQKQGADATLAMAPNAVNTKLEDILATIQS